MKWLFYVLGLIFGPAAFFCLIAGEWKMNGQDKGIAVVLLLAGAVLGVLTWIALRAAFRPRTDAPPAAAGSRVAKGFAIVWILALGGFLVFTRWSSANYQLESQQSRINDAREGLERGNAYLYPSDFENIGRIIDESGVWVPSGKKQAARRGLIELRAAYESERERRDR